MTIDLLTLPEPAAACGGEAREAAREQHRKAAERRRAAQEAHDAHVQTEVES